MSDVDGLETLHLAAAAYAEAVRDGADSVALGEHLGNISVPARLILAAAILAAADKPVSIVSLCQVAGVSRGSTYNHHKEAMTSIRENIPVLVRAQLAILGETSNAAELFDQVRERDETIRELRAELRTARRERNTALSYARDLHERLRPEFEDRPREAGESSAPQADSGWGSARRLRVVQVQIAAKNSPTLAPTSMTTSLEDAVQCTRRLDATLVAAARSWRGSGRGPAVRGGVLMAPGSVLLPGEPAEPPDGRQVIVACPDPRCGWLAVLPEVPQSCEWNFRHPSPGMVVAWLFCDQGCWEGPCTEFYVCTGNSSFEQHEVFIDPERSSFL
jgi:hypothetical protein